MNDKEAYIYKILDICVEECTFDLSEATNVKAEDILSKCKRENVVMTRCIFVTMMRFMGYSKTTAAAVLGRTEQAVTDILNVAHDYRKTSWAYRVAEAKCTLRIEPIKALY